MVHFEKLPIDILHCILDYLDIGYEKKTITFQDISFDMNNLYIVSKVYYIPSELCLINKQWFQAVKDSQCKMCFKGKYDLFKEKCIKCGHLKRKKKVCLSIH